MSAYGMSGWPPEEIVEVSVPGCSLALNHAPKHDEWAPVAASTTKKAQAGSLLGEPRDIEYDAPVAWVPRSHVFTGAFHLSTSRKAKGRAVVFEDADGRTFPMFLVEFVPLVAADLLGPGASCTGGLAIVRHGSRFGARYVG